MAAAFPRGGSLKLGVAPATDAHTKGAPSAPAGGLFKVAPEGHREKKRVAKGALNQSKKRSNNEVDKVAEEIAKRKKKKRFGKEEEPDVEDDARPKHSHQLRVKKINDGTLCLGAITHISESAAKVALPSGLSGVLRVDGLSDQHAAGAEGAKPSLSEYLSVGQIVLCSISVVAPEAPEASGKKRTWHLIKVSLAASAVNTVTAVKDASTQSLVYGTVQSVEDHGYVIDLGHDDVASGFLRFDVAGGSVDEPSLKVGQGVRAVVTSVSKGARGNKRVLQLDNSEAKVNSAMTTEARELSAIQPGMKVKCRATAWTNDGLAVSFCGFYNGTVDQFHLRDWRTDVKLMAKSEPYPRHHHMARVLFLDAEAKQVGLTFSERLVDRTERHAAKDARIIETLVGKPISSSVVRRIDGRKGILLEIPRGTAWQPEDADQQAMEKDDDASSEASQASVDELRDLFAYARRSQVDVGDNNKSKASYDVEDLEQLDKRFKVGEVTPCRALSYSPIEGTLSVSLVKSVIEASALVLDEVKPGDRVKGVVSKVTPTGLVVALSDRIQGFVPQQHLADVHISDPSKRFKEGQAVDCRVLAKDTSDVTRPRVFFTLKRALVHSDLPRIVSLETAKKGVVSHGVVTGSDNERGVFVTFYNNVSGRVLRSDLISLAIDNPAEVYKVGSVIKVRVLDCQVAKRKLTLSVRTASANIDAAKFEDGQFVSCKVSRRADNHIVAKLDSGTIFTIAAQHLTDAPARAEAVLASTSFKKGTRMPNAMVINAESGLLSNKPVLIAAKHHGAVPTTLAEVTPNTTVVGWVSRVNSIGVFVAFPGGLTALAPRANLADGFVTDPKEHFKEYQTVLAYVCDVKPEQSRIIVTLKPSAIEVPAFVQRAFMISTLAELRALEPSGAAGLATGSAVKATIKQLTEFGIELELEGGATGYCLREHTQDDFSSTVGDEVECVVLDTRSSTGHVDVSLRPSVVRAAKLSKTRMQSARDKALAATAPIMAVVELVKDAYVVLSLPGCESLLAVAPTSSPNGKLVGLEGLLPNAKCFVRVLGPEAYEGKAAHAEPLLIAQIEQDSTDERRMRARSRGASLDGSLKNRASKVVIKEGAEVAGNIRNIHNAYINVALPGSVCEVDLAGSDRLHGQLHICETQEAVDTVQGDIDNAFAAFSVGQTVQGTVVSLEPKVDHKSRNIVNVILTTRGDEGQGGPLRLELSDVEQGRVYDGIVEEVLPDGLGVALSRTVFGIVFAAQVSRDVQTLHEIFNKRNLEGPFRPGSHVKVRVLNSADPKRLALTMIH